MKIPSKIKISGVDYSIKLVNGENELDYKNDGKVNFIKNIITINENYPDPEIYRIFLHEIIHILSLDYSLKLEEDNVDRLAVGFYQIFKDNNLLKD